MKSQSNRRKRQTILPGLKALGVLGLCLLWLGCPKKGAPLQGFDHKSHSENTPECEMCHDTSSPDVSPRANHEVCELCHDFDMDAPDDSCLTCHALPEKDGKPIDIEQAADWSAELKKAYQENKGTRSENRGDLIFDHTPHENFDCAKCHGDVLEKNLKDLEPPFDMDACMACHRENGAPTDCAACHKVLREDVEPENHNISWEKRHGMESRLREKECAYCHQQSSCDDCHENERPDSHTAFFRKRGHGFFAEGDRRDCQVCHQVDFCESCHQEVEPISHNSSFKSRRHCSSCHFPIRKGTKCQVCHKDRTHPRSAAFAHPVSGLRSCAPCHRGKLIPHATNTIRSNECGRCHSAGGKVLGFPHSIRDFPNCRLCHSPNFAPHPVIGTSERDCFKCHAGDTGPRGLIPHPIDVLIDCSICHPGNISPHPLNAFSDRQCLNCHSQGPKIPVDDLDAPHTLRRVPFSRCSSCHIFSAQTEKELMRRGRRK